MKQESKRLEKKCAICGEIVPQKTIQCPKCGKGVFESEKSFSEQNKTNSLSHYPSHSQTEFNNNSHGTTIRATISTSFPNQSTAEHILHSSSDSDERLDAATALGKTNSKKVIPALTKALLNDDDEYVRSTCAGFLGSIKGPEAEKALLKAISDPEPYVRKRVIQALFRLGTGNAQKSILNATKDNDSNVRSLANKYTMKTLEKLKKTFCPFLTQFGMCDIPGVNDFQDCSWEV